MKRISCNECPYDVDCHKFPSEYTPFTCPTEDDSKVLQATIESNKRHLQMMETLANTRVVKSGYWDENNNCSECGAPAKVFVHGVEYPEDNFCWNCGANMRWRCSISESKIKEGDSANESN